MKKNSDEVTKPQISNEMLKNCKKAIARFGFQMWEYESFLDSVSSMKNGSVMQFPMSDLEKYRDRYVKQHEHGFNDVFIFDALSKIKVKNEEGKILETGYFMPRVFWDFIKNSK